MINIEQSSDLATILSFLLQIGLLLSAYFAGSAVGKKQSKMFHDKKESRLFDNIQRPVALIPTKDDSLEMESRLLKKTDFFDIDLLPADSRSLDDITAKYRLAVIRYEDSKGFWHMFHKLADSKIPLIIYSKPAEIPVKNMVKIQDYYTRYTLCNTPVRLLSDIYAIMSVYPEDEEA